MQFVLLNLEKNRVMLDHKYSGVYSGHLEYTTSFRPKIMKGLLCYWLWKLVAYPKKITYLADFGVPSEDSYVWVEYEDEWYRVFRNQFLNTGEVALWPGATISKKRLFQVVFEGE